MARKPRVYSEKGIYHVILRGNNQQNLFLYDNDRSFFLNRLFRYSNEMNIDIYAYCLMSNHVHLLIGKAATKVSLFIQKLANSYVYYFNRKYERTGHLFQGRFKSEPIEDEKYFKTVYRYILQNCEKANLGSFSEYKWNSFEYIINSKNKKRVNIQYILNMFDSKEQLIKFLSQKEKKKCMEFENKLIFSDEKVISIIQKIFKISSPDKLQRLNIDEQLTKCKILKNVGVTVNQISRITGVNKAIIKSA